MDIRLGASTKCVCVVIWGETQVLGGGAANIFGELVDIRRLGYKGHGQ